MTEVGFPIPAEDFVRQRGRDGGESQVMFT